MKRIDRYLSEANVATRKELREIIRRGRITVNDMIVCDPGKKVNEETDIIMLDGKRIETFGQIVIMLNKPDGYVCATEDAVEKTVMELIPDELRKAGVVPIGRLDKNTEGLLLLTNDGSLLHHIISPKHEIPKIYFAEHEGVLSEESLKRIHEGIVLKDGTVCRPAEIEVIGTHTCRVTVCEGKYHQVRRMLAACGCHVVYLKRVSEANLELGNLRAGNWRRLDKTEIRALSQ